MSISTSTIRPSRPTKATDHAEADANSAHRPDVGHRWLIAGNEHNADGIQPDGRRLDVMLTHPYRSQLP
jgi:hypothetical protein